jgi:cupin fold WbuC family metalloprotein
MIKITDDFLEGLSEKARDLPRKRINHNLHKNYGETVQRLLNAAEPGTYIRPHKHEDPDKIEVFMILKGRIVVVEFDADGSIRDHAVLDRAGEISVAEVPPRTWHSFIALDSGSVVYEFKEGPYDKIADKNFAPWAPKEGVPEAQAFNEKILGALKLR